MTTLSNGTTWLAHLAAGSPVHDWTAVQVVDSTLAGAPARYIAVVPDPQNRFPRARTGEVGLVEGWQLAQAVQETIEADRRAEPFCLPGVA